MTRTRVRADSGETPSRPERGQAFSERAITVAIPAQARENREYVRKLLKEKQPEFAAILALVEQDLSRDLTEPSACRDHCDCSASSA